MSMTCRQNSQQTYNNCLLSGTLNSMTMTRYAGCHALEMLYPAEK